ncbi:LutC/YkgG family protein [Maribellus mangrovi]|uniref:LutC/YkgG family protein n=1 Tax=Maribellus mangrovi TaxID=3133146 RepID=UPI0030EEA4DE
MASARQEILNKLKKAVHNEPEKPDFDAPVYFPLEEPLEESFKANLAKVNGSVHLCHSKAELYSELKTFLDRFVKELIVCNESNLKSNLQKHLVPFTSTSQLPNDLQVGITSCEYLIAHTGSVMISSAQGSERRLFVFPEIHVVIADSEQVVAYLEEAYSSIKKKYPDQLPSHISLLTGPSRTADIEKTLVLGAHGPRQFHVFINQNFNK